MTLESFLIPLITLLLGAWLGTTGSMYLIGNRLTKLEGTLTALCKSSEIAAAEIKDQARRLNTIETEHRMNHP
jgi:hypothetical protein